MSSVSTTRTAAQPSTTPVRMAVFSMHDVLIDGQGNFSSVGGDPPRRCVTQCASRASPASFFRSRQEHGRFRTELRRQETGRQIFSAISTSRQRPQDRSRHGDDVRPQPSRVHRRLHHNDPRLNVSLDAPSDLAGPISTGGVICGRDGVRQAYGADGVRSKSRRRQDRERKRGNTDRRHGASVSGEQGAPHRHIAASGESGRLRTPAFAAERSAGMRIVIELRPTPCRRFTLNQLWSHTAPSRRSA